MNDSYSQSIHGVDQLCFVQNNNPTWNAWDSKRGVQTRKGDYTWGGGRLKQNFLQVVHQNLEPWGNSNLNKKLVTHTHTHIHTHIHPYNVTKRTNKNTLFLPLLSITMQINVALSPHVVFRKSWCRNKIIVWINQGLEKMLVQIFWRSQFYFIVLYCFKTWQMTFVWSSQYIRQWHASLLLPDLVNVAQWYFSL